MYTPYNHHSDQYPEHFYHSKGSLVYFLRYHEATTTLTSIIID